jgi:hypothetical protein
VAEKIRNWRSHVWDKDYGESLFGPEGILSDEIVDTLASMGPIIRLAELERVVGSQWAWFGQYGDSLLDALLAMSIPALIPKDPKPRGTKRPAGKVAASSNEENERPMKKSRIEAQETMAIPTAVIGVPANSTYTTVTPFQGFHSSTSTATWIPLAHLATPQISRILPSTTLSGPFTPSTPTTPVAYYPPYNHWHNPYSSLMHQPPQYNTPYTYHMPTFYSPYTTPNQGRTPSQMSNSSFSSHSKTSNSALPNSSP